MFDWLIQNVCSFDDTIATTLGWSHSTYAIVTAIVTGALAWGFLAVWLSAFGRLRSAGLARRQQMLVWWFAFVVALVQITLTLLQGQDVELVPCPRSSLILLFVTFAFLLMAYGFHLQDENRASAAKFFKIIALPLLGEVAITAKATVNWVIKFAAWLL